ncbi:hypothetical protein PIB30_082361 [Stylosanthes scabra]|uniref:Uncharacterized protein n=1 Tax=Stylosanthes scabra TaxID=79078 RepID=A0ABU6SS71_9FABA|nr:hypothetical protein [Stylosanthes scabra]
MARKGKEVASTFTPSRSCTTKNSNRGKDGGFPTERFDSQIHHDRWKTMEHRGITNSASAAHQTHEFLQEWRIPFSEDDIRHFLGIDIDLWCAAALSGPRFPNLESVTEMQPSLKILSHYKNLTPKATLEK